MALFDSYCSEIHDNLKYYAAWVPNIPICIGDYGELKNNVFTRIGNIKALGVEYKINPQIAVQANLAYTSQNVSASKIGLNAEQLAAGLKVGMIIGFKNENSTYFELTDCISSTFDDLTSVGVELLNFLEFRKWEANWVVVSEVMTASKSIIYISNAENAEVKIGLKGSPDLAIGDLDVKLESLESKSIGIHIEGEFGLTPLFRLARIQKRLLSIKSPTFRPLAEGSVKSESLAEDYNVFDNIE